jgi:N-ATPase, AtpR subunit
MTSGLLAFAAAFVGLLFGIINFAALRRNVELYTGGLSGFAAAALTFGRLGGAVVLFSLAAKLGALPLLSAFLGFLLARWLALRAARRTM